MKRIPYFSGLILISLIFVLAAASQAATLSGRAYEGSVGDESHELPGVIVSLYGAPEAGGSRIHIVTQTTASNGWYGLPVVEGFEHYYIVAESGPDSTYTFEGATSVDGTASGNEIHYSTLSAPLDDQTLTGNKFWYKKEGEPPDDTPPTIVALSPPDDATNVAVDTDLSITFSEDIQSGTGNLVVKKSNDNSVVENVDVTGAQVVVTGSIVTIDLISDLAQSTEYYVQIDIGAFKDLADNNFSGISYTTAWSFTTVGEEPPANNPPVANDDSATTSQYTAVDIDVLFNDTDPDGDPLQIISVTSPTWGTTVNHVTYVTYIPSPVTAITAFNDTFDYTVGDGKGGTNTATVTVTVEEGGEPPEGTGTIRGMKYNDLDNNRQRDPNEPGVAGWQIELWMWMNSIYWDWTHISTTTTDAYGEYAFENLSSGEYQVREESRSDWTQTYPSGYHTVSLGAEQTVEDLDFGNHQTGTEPPGGTVIIRGVKYNDLNDNGIKDPNEPGLPGWEITLEDGSGNVLASATTNAYGQYTFEITEPGTYIVKEVQQPGWRQTDPVMPDGTQAPPIWIFSELPPYFVYDEIDFGNHETGTEPPGGTVIIRGVKYNDLNDNGTKDPNEPGLPGWEITLEDGSGNVLASATTNAYGQYTFEITEPGTYIVKEVQQPGWRQTDPVMPDGTQAPPIWIFSELPPYFVYDDIDFGNHETGTEPPEGTGSIRGMKYNDLNGNGQRDPNEPGIPGWTIFIDLNDNGVYDEDDWSRTTDANGNYSFNDLEAGVYRIHEVNQPGWRQTDPAVDGVPGYWLIDLEEGQEEINIDFGNIQSEGPPPGTGEIHGRKWNDRDGQGDPDQDEEGLPGWRIFAELEEVANGVWEPGEPFAITDDMGYYFIADLSPGTYQVSEENQQYWLQTFPPEKHYSGVMLSQGEVLMDLDFGNSEGEELLEACCLPDGSCENLTAEQCRARGGTPQGPGTACLGDNDGDGIDDICGDEPPTGEYDFGDAPDPNYPTLLASNGARHVIKQGFHLGSFIDAELNGYTSTLSDGDDLNPSVGPDDEDGVTMSPLIAPGQAVQITIVASDTGVVNAWLDFNINGSWADAGEHFIAAQPVSAGANSFTLNVPTGANLGVTHARFRFSSIRQLSYDGLAPDGEVEDYQLTIKEGEDNGRITGMKYNDIDGDGQILAGEPLMSGWKLFLDLNKNGYWEFGEPYGITDASGSCVIANATELVDNTTYRVTEVIQPGWQQTFPYSPPFYMSYHEVYYGSNIQNNVIFFNHRGEAELDFGDAPDPNYPTLFASNGARHIIVSGVCLGSSVDSEPDGQPSQYADGDDNKGSDDEDGVSWEYLWRGHTDTVDVTASKAGLLNAWIDFNIDGDWADPGEQIFADQPLNAGGNHLSFYVPEGLALGATPGRFRFSTEGGLSFVGQAKDGEVEDSFFYLIAYDFGDAPDPPYPTKLSSNGASHPNNSVVYLGSTVDHEVDGQPDPNAMGDDNDGTDDEDGVIFTSAIFPGGTSTVTVISSKTGCPLDAWIDFTIDGDWDDTGEHIFDDVYLNAGPNYLSFNVPEAASLGTTFARFRLVWGDLPLISYDGQDDLGEVEDYQVKIGEDGPYPPPVTEEYDFGDAPDPNYPTLLSNNGARHVVDEDLFLGYTIDPEANGQPTPNADGDDNTGNNDEDGVTMSPFIAPGQAVPITVVASAGGVLNAWLDFNIDGSWADASEHIIAAQPVSSGANSFTINVPANARLGQTYARFRLSSVRDLSYDGQAPDGEVEDYTVEINAGGQVGGTIIIEKQTIPDGAPDMFSFTGLLMGGLLGDGAQYIVGGLEPGQYSVQEQMTSGWTLTDIVFSDNNSTKNLQTRTATISLEAGETVKAVFTNRKATSTPAPVTFPQGDWPTYAQDEISVHPEPPTAGSLTRLCAEVVNNDPVNAHVVTLEFRVANFGIGLPWNAVGSTSVHVPPGSVASGCVVWTPPGPGHWCIEVVLHQEGAEPQRSQRNIDADEPLQPGESHSRVFEVGNPFDHRVDITLGLVPHLDGWGLELYPDILLDMAPGEIREVTLTVTPPQGEPLPPDGTVIVDVEALVDGELIGGFRKTFRPPVPLHRFPDPPYAEGEITVHPYPVQAGEPTEVCVELRNPTADPLDVMVQFSWANFGIGIPFTPINGLRPVHLPPHSTVKECIHWIPPVSGSVCIQVELHMEGYDPQCSQRNIDIDEPLQPGESHSRVFEVGNPFDHRVDITLGLVPHLPNWGLELYPDILLDMAPGEIREVTLTVTPPPDEPLPAAGEVIVDVEAYAEGELIGGFRKVFSPPVTVHRPKDPVYAETEIGVDPYPIVPGQPVEFSVELRNPTDTDHVLQTRFSVAPFGIGLPFSDEHIMPNPIHIFVPAHGAARGHVTWNPPPGVTGKFCVQVTLELEGHEPLWSRRCIDVGEPLRRGEPHSLTFPVGNPFDHRVDITLGLVPHLPNWGLELYPDILLDMAPGEIREVTLTVTPPPDEPLPAAGEVIVDVEAYVDGELIGGFRKLYVPPVSVHKPHEKSYAETEISVDPDPPQEGQETTVSAVLHNTGDVPVVVNVEFGWADFGMGIPFSNVGMVPPVQMVTLAPSALTSVDAAWTPTQSGHQCILIRLTDPEGQLDPQESQRNVDVTEPPPCEETVVFTFTVYNDSPFPITVDIGMITFNVPNDWEVTIDPTGSVLVGPHDEVEIKVIVKIPCPPSLQVADILQRVGGGVPTIDVEGYINGELEGGIQIQFGEIITAPGSALPTGQIHHSKSIDNGTVFEPGALIEDASAEPAPRINPAIVVDDQGIIHVVWEDYRTDPSLGNIMYAKSTDGGRRFGESVMVDDALTVSTHQAKPKIAVDSDGIIHVVWEDYRRDSQLGDIYYAKSTDGGMTFGDDVCVDDPITITSRQINPVIAVDSRETIHVAWEDYRDNAELGNIYYAKSTDGGQTFGTDTRIDDIFTDTTHQCNPAIAVDPLETLFIVWEDYRNAPHLGDIYCARSTDGGETFEENLMVDDPITITHRQIRPAVAVDDKGIVYVAWEDYRDNTELGNIYCAKSMDSGKTFENDVMVDDAVTISTHQAKPAIATAGQGLVHIVWEDFRDQSGQANIYYSMSSDEGKVFGEDLIVNQPGTTASSQHNPAIAVDNLGVVHLVWQE